MATNPEVDPAVAVDPALAETPAVEPTVAEAVPTATADMVIDGVPGSFANPHVTCGGANTGIGLGTNAVYDNKARAPFGNSEGSSIAARAIGEFLAYSTLLGFRKPGDPLTLLVSKEAEQDTIDGASLGNRASNGKPVINKTGGLVKDGQYTVGHST
jgi:hypothetical protein